MPNNFIISIVICSYNRSELLIESLQSLIKDDSPKNSFEIIVVDNNSSDNTESAVKEFISNHSTHNLRYVKETQQGLSYARNRGIQEAVAPLVSFVDDDVIVGKNFIQIWLDFFASHPHAIGAGGRIKVQFDDPRPNWMPELMLPLFGKHNLGKEIKKYSGGRFPLGGNMVYRKDAFEKAGVFNTDLGRKGNELDGGEEKDIYLRIAQLNDSIFYVPNAYLWHRVGAQRLTKDYVKGQAFGVGKSIAVILQDKSTSTVISKWGSEIFKFAVSIGLSIGYILIGRPSKGIMVIKFRKWVWEGYFDRKKTLSKKS